MMNQNIQSKLGKIAIVGAGGFVGSRMVEIFHLMHVAEIVPVVRRVASMARLSRFQLDIAIADGHNSEQLAKALHGCDVVVDCTVGMPRDIEAGAKVLIPAAKAAGVKRVVYLSSASVHGQNPMPGSNEDTPLSDRQEMAYNNAKVHAERSLFSDALRYGVELFVLRPSIVFGPRDRWVTTLVEDLQGGAAWLIDNGQGICNTIYVDNLIEAVRCCLSAPSEAAGRPYLVGDAEEVSWYHLYERVAKALDVGIEAVHQLPVPPAPVRTPSDVFGEIRARPSTQKLIAAVPRRVKDLGKGVLAGLSPQALPNPWQLPSSPPTVSPTREMVLLQQCRHRFSHGRAAQSIGYKPVVPFEEGLRRTLAWIEWSST
jgi:nucleoside-diphosphate-sugar epimerase